MNFFPLIDSPEMISPFIIEKINDILHSNARITLIPKILSTHYRPLNFIATLEKLSDCLHKSFLHKDLHHLERSESFCDLELLEHCTLQRSHSCPDLSGIHHMHPKLHGILIGRTTDSREDVEVPVGLQKCKSFILDYWTETVPSPIPKM